MDYGHKAAQILSGCGKVKGMFHCNGRVCMAGALAKALGWDPLYIGYGDFKLTHPMLQHLLHRLALKIDPEGCLDNKIVYMFSDESDLATAVKKLEELDEE